MDIDIISRSVRQEPLLQLGHCKARCEELQQVVKTSEEESFPLGRVAWDLVVSGNDHFDLKILNF